VGWRIGAAVRRGVDDIEFGLHVSGAPDLQINLPLLPAQVDALLVDNASMFLKLCVACARTGHMVPSAFVRGRPAGEGALRKAARQST
jgi:hypothetical protein